MSPAGRKRPLDLSGSGMWQIGKAAWKESGQDNLALIASGVAFYIFLAFVPLLMSVVLTYGLVASPAQVAKDISALSSSMPKEASSIISGQLESIVKTAGVQPGSASSCRCSSRSTGRRRRPAEWSLRSMSPSTSRKRGLSSE